METKMVVFKNKQIRRTLHNKEWWFVITDVVAALTDSVDPAGYIKDMRRRDGELAKGWGQIATPLSIDTPENYLDEPESRKRLKHRKDRKVLP